MTMWRAIRTMRAPAISLVIALASAVLPAQTSPPKKIRLDGFAVIGIEARTSNAAEMKGEGVISKQWQKFFSDGVQQKVRGQVDQNIYAVYADYASDRNGEYSFVIGVRVGAGSTAPPGMVLKHIPTGKYAVVTSEKGPTAKVVMNAWQRVWALEDKGGLVGKRAYKADFEVYDSRSKDPQNSQVDLYIGLR